MSGKDSQGYSFDFGNRLREATGVEKYRYDAYGRRILANRLSGPAGSTGVIYSQYAQNGQLLYQENVRAAVNTKTDSIYLGGSLVAQREVPIGGGAAVIKYQHTDALGSPVAVTGSTGTVLERMDYEPYGQRIGGAPKDGPGYTGHVLDTATGMNYMQQRYYDPAIGRFLSVDPVTANSGTGANFNRYWYANDNPYKFSDPDGRESCERGSMACHPSLAGALTTTLRSPIDTGNLQKVNAVNPTPNVKLRPGVELKDDFVKNDLQALSDSEAVGGKDVDVISGYRSQEKQDKERAAGNARAAKSSQHTHGRAADIKIKGMSKSEVGKAALDLGRFERVNVYSAPNAGVHVDYLDVGEGSQMYNDWKRVSSP